LEYRQSKNTIKRVAEFAENNKISDLVQEATGRYKRHLPVSKNGKVITKTRSRFKQYFFRLAKELEVNLSQLFMGIYLLGITTKKALEHARKMS